MALSLEQINDRIEIEELLARYSRALDYRNWADLEAIFTPDGEFDAGGLGHPHGPRAIREMIEGTIGGLDATQHLVGKIRQLSERVFEVSALCHRNQPVYHAINGVGRETIMLRKYVLEASLLKALSAAVPIVQDVEMTAGGLHRFHAVIQVKKTSPQHEGFQRNAIDRKSVV